MRAENYCISIPPYLHFSRGRSRVLQHCTGPVPSFWFSLKKTESLHHMKKKQVEEISCLVWIGPGPNILAVTTPPIHLPFRRLENYWLLSSTECIPPPLPPNWLRDLLQKSLNFHRCDKMLTSASSDETTRLGISLPNSDLLSEVQPARPLKCQRRFSNLSVPL